MGRLRGASPLTGSKRFYLVIPGNIPESSLTKSQPVNSAANSYDGGVVIFPDGQIIEQAGWDQDAKRTPEERMAFHKAVTSGASDCEQ